ncbi:unnamed protein product [Spirodela intermedia]|uniref:Uncharacterized protein n=1 Tax=Spirodela intermedia TaxID=51605 RepID=A0A7I8KBB9_SPIIN|nr:unnamed protein product [Spirodela intermedia]
MQVRWGGVFAVVTAALYPTVLPHRAAIFRQEVPGELFQGFGTSIGGAAPARALYMAAVEVTKNYSAAYAAQLGVVWTPVEVVTQRLMMQWAPQRGPSAAKYRSGVDAFRKILMEDGPRGVYRRFGFSLFKYAPFSGVWWGTYSLLYRCISPSLESHCQEWKPDAPAAGYNQAAASATVKGAMSVLVTMPLDTIKTRMLVAEGGRKPAGSFFIALRSLAKEGGGWAAGYRGLGPRWVSTSLSGAGMATTYETLKRHSAEPVTLDPPP